MTDFIKKFLAIAAFMATIAGFWVGAAAINAIWAFWVIIVGSLTVAFAAVVAPKWIRAFIDHSDRARKYPSLLRKAAALEVENSDLKFALHDAQTESQRAYERGTADAWLEVLGSYYASQANAPLLKAVINEDDQAILIAQSQGEPPHPGARYSVVSTLSEEVKGVVVVRGFSPTAERVELVCVNVTQPDFWRELAREAILSAHPPTDIQLVPYNLDFEMIRNITTSGEAGSSPGD